MERLALAAKVLYSQDLLDKQKQIEHLQLAIFFRDYTLGGLRDAMNAFNLLVTRCACNTCKVTGAVTEEDLAQEDAQFQNERTWTCSFQEAFEAKVASYGLIVGRSIDGANEPRDPYGTIAHGYNCSHAFVEADCHLSLIGRCDWLFISIGKRLWGVSTIANTELQKYKRLIDDIMQQYND